MNAWVLVFWVYGSNPALPPSVTTQELNTRKECVDTAIALRREFGDRFGFICKEKGAKKK